MVNLDQYKRAELDYSERELKMGWRIHATVYAIVMTGLIILNIILVTQTDEDFLWFFFPLVGWGIGLTVHYMHAVRWADRELRARQARIEQRAGGLH